jgi:hypothetical protein
VGKEARKAPREALKEAWKLKNRPRFHKKKQNSAPAQIKNTRYAIERIKVDLIRVSLSNSVV